MNVDHNRPLLELQLSTQGFGPKTCSIITKMLACLPYLYTISGELLHVARLGSWDPAKAPALTTDVGSPGSTRVEWLG